jgi:hypothetical protein
MPLRATIPEDSTLHVTVSKIIKVMARTVIEAQKEKPLSFGTAYDPLPQHWRALETHHSARHRSPNAGIYCLSSSTFTTSSSPLYKMTDHWCTNDLVYRCNINPTEPPNDTNSTSMIIAPTTYALHPTHHATLHSGCRLLYQSHPV